MSDSPDRNNEKGTRRKVQFCIEQGDEGVHLHAFLPPDPEASDEMILNHSWKWLSPLEARVVKLLCVSDWLTREEIAARLDENPEGKIGGILTGLAERNVLESLPRKGYRLGLPDDMKPEEYRKALLAWLADRTPGD